MPSTTMTGMEVFCRSSRRPSCCLKRSVKRRLIVAGRRSPAPNGITIEDQQNVEIPFEAGLVENARLVFCVQNQKGYADRYACTHRHIRTARHPGAIGASLSARRLFQGNCPHNGRGVPRLLNLLRTSRYATFADVPLRHPDQINDVAQ
jgi:hypothetical protein